MNYNTPTTDNGRTIRLAIIGAAVLGAGFLYYRYKKNQTPSKIYETLKSELGWPEKEHKSTKPEWAKISWLQKMTNRFIRKDVNLGDKKYRVFIWPNGRMYIKEFDEAKTYPVFYSGEFKSVKPRLVIETLTPESSKGVKFKAWNIESLLKRISGKEVKL